MKPASNRHAKLAATAWPAEDGGPLRQGRPHGVAGPKAGSAKLVATRETMLSVMMLLAPDGEVLVLRSSLGEDGVSWIERIDPDSLEELDRSPGLGIGPFWPGGFGLLDDGAIIVVQGRWIHRLNADLTLDRSRALPIEAPYNSFVVLGDGSIATKDLQFPTGSNSKVSILDPVTLEDRCPPIDLPEPSVARIAATEDEVFIIGVTALHRVSWDSTSQTATINSDKQVDYLLHENQSFGWDPIIDAGHVWWMDNGDHNYTNGFTMLGNGNATGPNRLWKAPLGGGPASSVEVSGLSGGVVTNPPLVEPERGLAIAFDSGNGVLAAFRVTDLSLVWRIELNASQHMWLYPDTGELVTNDFDRDAGDSLVVIDIETGDVRCRVPVGSFAQSVVFGAPGHKRDAYFCSLSTIAHVAFDD